MKRIVQNDIHLLDEVHGCVERMEVLEGPTGRRTWPDDEDQKMIWGIVFPRKVKARIVGESLEPGARVCDVARRNGKLPISITDETFPAFAMLEVSDEVSSPSSPPLACIEIDATGVIVRLPIETPAGRVAEIAVALRTAR